VSPNRLWVADLTYVSTWSGFAYVAFVVDAYARRILGWPVASTMATSMVLDAFVESGCMSSRFIPESFRRDRQGS